MAVTDFNSSIQDVEVMAPVGSYESLAAAVQAGADSVYFGVGKLNMRSRSANNFSLDDLAQICSIAHSHGIRTYLTVNTIIYDDEISEMHAIIDRAKAEGVSAIIASDMAVINYARSQGVEVHISTQANISNIEAVEFFSRYADVMVTARELSLKQVAAIHEQIKARDIHGPKGELVQLEVFAHGALCMSVSGKCYLSLDNYNSPANRGACLQPCRRAYEVRDVEDGLELLIDNQYIMSPKDLCTIGFLDKIVKAGVSVLKIEGRGRSPEYVKMVTECYHEALESIYDQTFSIEKIDGWMVRLRSVYNRDFWDGYYLGRTMGEWAERYGSQATRMKRRIGKITNYFGNIGVAEICVEEDHLSVGDDLLIIGSTTGVYEDHIQEIRVDDKPVESAAQGVYCSVKTKELVRRGDQVYRWIMVKDEF